MMKKWNSVWILTLACMVLFGSVPVGAQEYPSKSIEVVVGFAPGGGTDMVARAIADVAAKYIGQPLVVNNKPGASGIIGSQYVYNAKPDGYTILVAGGARPFRSPTSRACRSIPSPTSIPSSA